MKTIDLLTDVVPHGTKAGYDAGCKGSACPAPVACREVQSRYMGDYGFRKLIDSGLTAAQILEQEAAVAEQAQAAAVARELERRRVVEEERAAAKETAKQERAQVRADARAKAREAARAAQGPSRSEVARQAASERRAAALVVWRTRLGELRQAAHGAAASARSAARAVEVHKSRRPGGVPMPTSVVSNGDRYATEHDDAVREMAGRGLNNGEIGRALNLDPRRVASMRHRLRLPSAPLGHPRAGRTVE